MSKVLPRSLHADRDDIVQQAMLRALREVERGGDPGPGYLRKAAWSATVDELRRRRSSRLELVDEAVEPASSQADPEGALADQRLGDAIRACLAAVTPTRRPALTLWLLGHSFPEAARMLATSAKTVENAVYRGLTDLRGCLAGRGFAP